MKSLCTMLMLLLVSSSCCVAGDLFSTSGNLALRGVVRLDSDSASEYPSLLGRLKLDTPSSAWRFHAWLEGGWDGSVRLPARDRMILKSFDDVYQSNTPFLELKELYLSYGRDVFEMRLGIQRFAWGRLDEYPVNDLLNPWDYTQFLRKPLEDRKIGVPSVSANLANDDWSLDAVWVPLFVPYRLPLPTERWAGSSELSTLGKQSGVELNIAEPNLPPRTLKSGSLGMRLRHMGDLEWALNVFHGYDPRPVFRTTALVVAPLPGKLFIDPGYVPDFHKMTAIGLDAAAVKGEWSIRAEAAYSIGRYFNTRRELWGYPATLTPGVYLLNNNERKFDVFDYGIGVDYRLFEDALLTMQAQQTVIMGDPDLLYEKRFETLLWANLKAGWLNQKIETNLNVAYNPEHGDVMAKANAWYVFSDSWKAGVTAVTFFGPSQSLFGRYSDNDQIETELVFSW